MLAKRASPKKSKEESWYEMYKLLFPGSIPPDSPYLDDALVEELSGFQEFITSHAPPVVNRIVGERLPESLRPQQESVLAYIQGLVPELTSEIIGMYVTEVRSGYRSEPSTRPATVNSVLPRDSAETSVETGTQETSSRHDSHGSDEAADSLNSSTGNGTGTTCHDPYEGSSNTERLPNELQSCFMIGKGPAGEPSVAAQLAHIWPSQPNNIVEDGSFMNELDDSQESAGNDESTLRTWHELFGDSHSDNPAPTLLEDTQWDWAAQSNTMAMYLAEETASEANDFSIQGVVPRQDKGKGKGKGKEKAT